MGLFFFFFLGGGRFQDRFDQDDYLGSVVVPLPAAQGSRLGRSLSTGDGAGGATYGWCEKYSAQGMFPAPLKECSPRREEYSAEGIFR